LKGHWTVELRQLIIFLAIGWLASLWLGNIAFALALAAFILWYFYKLHLISKWLRSGKLSYPPEMHGLLGELVFLVQRLWKKGRKHKKHLASILNQFHETSDAMPDATVVLNVNQEIQWLNDAARRLLNLNPRQDLGRPISNLIRHPEFIVYLEKGEFNEPLEIVASHSEDIRLHIHVVPYGNKQLLLTARDVSRVYLLERMRREFIGNVSHELRTPLTVILGYLEIVLENKNTDAVARQLSQAREQAQRMLQIVEDLLTLSRLETADAQTFQFSTVNVASLVNEVHGEANILATEKGHTIHLEVDESLWLKANAKLLHSVFSNLVNNAIRYTQENGNIVLRWFKNDDGSCCFEVQDDGIGILEDHIPKLTERFYRVDKDRSRITGGTGLGLAIVKHILQIHHAQLEIESEYGKGSAFRCVFQPDSVITKHSPKLAHA